MKNSATDVARELQDKITGERSELLLSSLSVTEEEQRLQITCWCRSGTKCFKPTEEPFKNCVEVAIFEFTKLVLKVVERQRKIVKTNISYMTDLSPCPVCIKRLPNQKCKLEAEFPNIAISYNDEQYIMNYKEYHQLKGPETFIKRLEELSQRQNNYETSLGLAVPGFDLNLLA